MVRRIEDLEREEILKACQEIGNADAMCRALGIGRATLFRRLQAYGVSLRPETSRRQQRLERRERAEARDSEIARLAIERSNARRDEFQGIGSQ